VEGEERLEEVPCSAWERRGEICKNPSTKYGKRSTRGETDVTFCLLPSMLFAAALWSTLNKPYGI
jgi:hypothetical protein